MVLYRIPNLLSYLQAYIKPNNPNHDVIEAEYMAWIDASCFFSDEHKRAWKDVEVPLLASRAFPESSLESLRVCLEYLTGGILLEQLTDAPATTAQAQKWADVYKQAFKQTLGETEGPAAIIKYFTDRVLDAIKGSYRPYLVESNILLAEGMVKEAADREKPGTQLSLEMYMKTRRDTIGARSFFDIGRWIHKINIAREVLMHPDIVKIEEQIIDLVSLANDLYSYKKEFFECGANHNYITIALRDPVTNLRKNDLQGAIDYTCQRFYEVLEDLERRKKMLPSFGESEDAKVVRYLGVLMDIVVGTIQWSLECGRYGYHEFTGTVEAPKQGVVFDLDPL